MATYAALLNQGDIWWVVNLCLSIFILGTLLDWESFLWVLCLGTGAGYLFARSQFLIVLTLPTQALYPSIYILVVSVVAGLIFSRRRENLQEERQRALKTMSGAIAHEMRTPLATIIMMGTSLRHIVGKIENFFKKKEISVSGLEREIEEIYHISDDLLETAKDSQNLITLLLANLKQNFDVLPQKVLSLGECLNHALETFVLSSEEKGKVHLHVEEDFYFKGNQELMTHVVFNLLKNSLYFIHACGKGEIFHHGSG